MNYKHLHIRYTLPVLLVVISLLMTACTSGPSSPDSGQSQTGQDWPMYLHDPGRSGASNEDILTSSNVNQLVERWTFKTKGIIAASSTVVGTNIYAGSWDGYEYSIDSQSGALNWKTFLGITTANSYCSPSQAGISSAAAVQDGTVYVGGGDSYWYALNALTGAVEWKVYTGDSTAKGGNYNWSSPLLYNGYAYIGIASMGDCPLVQGLLMQVSLRTHRVTHTFDVVPKGEIGGGIWSSPVVDSTTNTIYVTTGTENAITQPYAQAVLALDASTLVIKDWWKLPEPVAIVDSDFGATPTLFQDASGTPMIDAINKNGYAYAFKRNDLKAGPVWQRYIAVGGPCPLCGQSSVSTGTFGGGKLYLAGEDTTIGSSGYEGSVRALDPATGNVLWAHKASGPVMGSLVYTNGMIIDAAGNVLEVLSAADGSRLASYALAAQVYAAPVISHGQILVGDLAGILYAFGLPDPGTQTNPTGTSCLGSYVCMDIGRSASPGTEASSGHAWVVSAGGAGIGGTIDQFHFITQSTRGDIAISTKITSLQASNNQAQAGLMVRQTSSRESPNYTVFVSNDHHITAQYRAVVRGGSVTFTTKTKVSFPLYLQIQRTGDQFQAATSTDGVHYTLVPGSTVVLVMPVQVLTGLVLDAGSDTATSRATYTAVSTGSPTRLGLLNLVPTPITAPCPAPWTCEGVGNPSVVGSQSFSGQSWTVQGAGVDIDSHWDQFQYVWRPLVDNGTVSAQILSQTRTDAWAKAGVMIRQSIGADAPYYAALVTPANGLVIQSRADQGLSTTMYSVPSTGKPLLPLYIEIARSGTTFSTYISNDDVNWTYVFGTSVTINMTGSVLAGLAISSHNAAQLGSAKLDAVGFSTQAPPAPTACPDAWLCTDVGYAMLGGTQVYRDGSWTLQAGGSDIGKTADQFHGVWQVLSNDGSVSAHILQIADTDDYAKAGVMLRQSVEPGSPYYAVFVTAKKGLILQYRVAQDSISVANDFPATGAMPIYLMVGRVGNDFSAYTSNDGVNWQIVPGSTRTLSISTKLLAGLTLTSHSSLQLCTALFDTVSISSTTR